MTLPQTLILPLRADFKDFDDINRYLRDLVFELQSMYENLTQEVNGQFRSYAQTPSIQSQRSQWVPVLNGTSTDGTFTYSHQVGWVIRRNLLVDVWFDVAWTSPGAATGNLYLILPYRVTITDQIPFSEVLQTSNISYGVGNTLLSINAISNTYRGEFWTSGSGLPTANLAVAGSGRLIGHIAYIGQSDET